MAMSNYSSERTSLSGRRSTPTLGTVTERVAVIAVANESTLFCKEYPMMKRTAIVSALAAALTLSAGVSLGADQQETLYGSQIMTQQERNEYHTKIRAAKTAEEREQIRKEHHERMKERAKTQGVTLPDEPPARGGGMGPGGGGMGPGGGGMGPGGGRGR
jgi:uncharacterized protein HemX